MTGDTREERELIAGLVTVTPVPLGKVVYMTSGRRTL